MVSDPDIQRLSDGIPVSSKFTEEFFCEAAIRGREELVLTILEKGYIRPEFSKYNTAHTAIMAAAENSYNVRLFQVLGTRFPLIKNQTGAILTAAARSYNHKLVESIIADPNYKVQSNHLEQLGMIAVEKGDTDLLRIVLDQLHATDEFNYAYVCIHALKDGTMRGNYEFVKFVTEIVDTSKSPEMMASALELSKEAANSIIENGNKLRQLLHEYSL